MSAATAKRMAWCLAALSLAVDLGGLTLAVTARSSVESQDPYLLVVVIVFSTIGVLIASSQVRNPIGWIYLGVALSAGLAEAAGGCSVWWLAGGSPRILGEIATGYAQPAWLGWVLVPLTFLLLLFPDGRLLSRRWRPVAWCAGLAIAGEFVVGLVTPWPPEEYPHVTNPIGVESAILSPIEGITTLIALAAIIGSVLSLVLRFRRVVGLQRQQIKWLAYAGGVVAPTVLVAVVAYDELGAAVANWVIQIAILGLPLAAGVAILRYRLYDIDVVVNRTLVYGALTATLAAAYVGTVLLLQVVLAPLTDASDLSVAGSTLAVAALFRPLRERIQHAVDRRFYRKRYDAVRTVAEFSGRLREQVDLEALTADLRDVVRQTVQPEHVSLWMPAPEARS